MPHEVGSVHKVPFFSSTTGLITTDFVVERFTVDTVPVSAGVLASLSVASVTGSPAGYYVASYTPDTIGFHYLGIFNAAHSVRVLDGIDIEEGEVIVNLTQNTPTTGALKPTIASPDTYLLLVMNSSEWQVGKTHARYAVAITELDSSGNWMEPTLPVVPGTYHIVLKNNTGTTMVLRPFLTV